MILLYPLYNGGLCKDTLLTVFYQSLVVSCVVEGSFDVGSLCWISDGQRMVEWRKRVRNAAFWMAVVTAVCWVMVLVAMVVAHYVGIDKCERFPWGKWW